MTYRHQELIERVERTRNRIVLAAGLTPEQREHARRAIDALDDLRDVLLDEQEEEA